MCLLAQLVHVRRVAHAYGHVHMHACMLDMHVRCVYAYMLHACNRMVMQVHAGVRCCASLSSGGLACVRACCACVRVMHACMRRVHACMY